MSEPTPLTKEQIQTQYNDTVGILGQKLFNFCKPIVEMLGHMNFLLSMNHQMTQLLQKEAAEKKVDEKLGIKE